MNNFQNVRACNIRSIFEGDNEYIGADLVLCKPDRSLFLKQTFGTTDDAGFTLRVLVSNMTAKVELCAVKDEYAKLIADSQKNHISYFTPEEMETKVLTVIDSVVYGAVNSNEFHAITDAINDCLREEGLSVKVTDILNEVNMRNSISDRDRS